MARSSAATTPVAFLCLIAAAGRWAANAFPRSPIGASLGSEHVVEEWGWMPGADRRGAARSSSVLSGGGPSSGSAAGKGGDEVDHSPSLTVVGQDNGVLIGVGRLVMRVANAGGRITSCKIDGVETLTQADSQAAESGATFWTSPQADWGWPPPAAIDTGHYSAKFGEGLVKVTADEDISLRDTTVSVSKTFRPAGANAIEVVYDVTNTGESDVTMAGWQVTRVDRGVTFYPTGQGATPASSFEMNTSLGYSWATYPGVAQKNFGDGAGGWLAHAQTVASTGVLLLQQFEDIGAAQFAPGESEIELYGDPGGLYMELECQGPYTFVRGGGTLSWSVIWKGEVLGAGTAIAEGSADLADAAERLKGQDAREQGRVLLSLPRQLTWGGQDGVSRDRMQHRW
eukprot:evm.model.scf_382EXC.2 EVM.evm.TU.scf_382EXC.2   scf_382EXC:48167-49363(+)